jgi:hypothetical protein
VQGPSALSTQSQCGVDCCSLRLDQPCQHGALCTQKQPAQNKDKQLTTAAVMLWSMWCSAT